MTSIIPFLLHRGVVGAPLIGRCPEDVPVR